MTARHRILLTGGGTGGHVYPALAVAEVLRERPEVEALLYIGVSGHIEERLARERQIDFVGLKVSGMPRRFSPRLFTWPFELSAAVLQARKIMQKFAPSVVLGTGGYAAAPPLAAARSLGIPYAIHEPDAHAGLVNRVFASGAQLVSLGMEAGARRLKSSRGRTIVNGNPVRRSFNSLMARDAACAVLGLHRDMKTVLITGGSQGAQAINDAVAAALPSLMQLDPPIQVLHQAGEKNINLLRDRLDPSVLHNSRYVLRPYFEDLSLPYAVSDLAICRAGAMTIAELTVTGVPAIFIPYPFAAADHQTHNARFLSDRGAAMLIPQTKLTGQSLKDHIVSLLGSEDRLKSMRTAMRALGKPNAAEDLASQLLDLSAGKASTRLLQSAQ